jgi:hypothetical protein
MRVRWEVTKAGSLRYAPRAFAPSLPGTPQCRSSNVSSGRYFKSPKRAQLRVRVRHNRRACMREGTLTDVCCGVGGRLGLLGRVVHANVESWCDHENE